MEDPFLKIDIVLDFLASDKKAYGMHNADIIKGVELLGIDASDGIVREILYKLTKEGYVRVEKSEVYDNFKVIPDIDFFIVTFEGRVLISSGGYSNMIRDAAINKSRIRSYETKLLWATWIAGVAASFVLIWQVFLYFYPVHKDYSYWIWETIPKKKP